MQLDARATKRQNIEAMRAEVKWYKPRRGALPHSRQYYRANNGGQSARNMTVKECCEEIWSKYGEGWRAEVNLRKRSDPSNIPPGE